MKLRGNVMFFIGNVNHDFFVSEHSKVFGYMYLGKSVDPLFIASWLVDEVQYNMYKSIKQ